MSMELNIDASLDEEFGAYVQHLEEQLPDAAAATNDVVENDAYLRYLEEQLLDFTTTDAIDMGESDAYVRHLEDQQLDPTTVITVADDVPEKGASQALVLPTCSNTWPSDYHLDYQIILNSKPPIRMSRTLEEDARRQVLQGPEMVTNTPIQVYSNAQQYNNHQTNNSMHQNQISDSIPQTHTITSTHQFDQQRLSNIPLNQSVPTDQLFGSPQIPHHNFPVNQSHPMNQFISQIPHNFQVHQASHPMNQVNPPQVPSGFQVQMTSPTINQQFNLQQNVAQATPYMPTRSVHLQPNQMQMFPKFSSSSNPFHAHSTPKNHNVSSIHPICHYNPQNLPNGHQYNPQPHRGFLSQTSLEFSPVFNRQNFVNQPLLNSEAPNNVHTDINKRKSWTEEEHRLFLIGLQRYGKGNWKNISENVVKTRTPVQIASHAQKFFDHQINKGNKKRRRKSIHDITNPDVLMHQSYNPQNPPIVVQPLQFVNPNSTFLL